MNILFYTVNDGNSAYLKCLDIAYKSLVMHLGDIEFNVYTDNKNHNKIKNYNSYALEKIAKYWNYIGDLKYHPEIFQQDYDYFVYLDSDILWKYKNNNHINSYGFIVNEGKISREDEQHTLSWNELEIKEYNNHWGVNAGLFGLKKDIAMELSSFFAEEVNNYHCKDIADQGKIEQSLFNKFIICKNYYNKLLNFSENVINLYNLEQLEWAQKNPQNKIYHFMSFGQGEKKFKFMSSLSDEK